MMNGLGLKFNADFSDNTFVTADEKVYSWAGLKTKRIKRENWSISLPRGYVEISSSSNETVVLVPKKCVDLPQKSCPAVVTIQSYDYSSPDDLSSSVYYRLVFNKHLKDRIEQSFTNNCELKEYDYTEFPDKYAVFLTSSVEEKDVNLIALVLEGNICIEIQIHASDPGENNVILLQNSLDEWIRTAVIIPRTEIADSLVADALAEETKQGSIKGFSDCVEKLHSDYEALIRSEQEIRRILEDHDLKYSDVNSRIHEYLTESLEYYAGDLLKIDSVIEEIQSETNDLHVMHDVLQKTEILKKLILSEKTETDVITIPRNGTVDLCFSKWQAMANNLNEVFEDEKNRINRIANKKNVLEQCDQMLTEYRNGLSDFQEIKLQELKNHIVQKQYDLEEQVVLLEKERGKIKIFGGSEKKKLDREIDRMIGQVREYDNPKCLEQGQQYIIREVTNSRKRYTALLNNYLLNRYPYEALKQKQQKTYLESYEGYLYSKKLLLFSWLKANTGYRKDIVDKLAQETGIPVSTVEVLLKTMEQDKLIRKKTHRFRDPVYEVIAEEVPVPHELSETVSCDGIIISDEYDEAPSYKNTSVPLAEDIIQLEQKIDEYIDQYDGNLRG